MTTFIEKRSGEPDGLKSFHDRLLGKEHTVKTIPLGAVKLDKAIVDSSLITGLNAAIEQGVAHSSIVVRERIAESGTPEYDIIRGFHNAVAHHGTSATEIAAQVYTGDMISDDELLNLRLRATAEGPESLRFARFATYLIEGFAQTPFAAKGVTVDQAFGWGRSFVKNPRTNLAEQELASLRTWVRTKAEICEMDPSSLHGNIISPAAKADPELVREARNPGQGKRNYKGILTPAQIAVTVAPEFFPGEENYQIQRRIAAVITAQEGVSPRTLEEMLRAIRAAMSRSDQPAKVEEMPQQPERPASMLPEMLEGKPVERIDIPFNQIDMTGVITDTAYRDELRAFHQQHKGDLPPIKVRATERDGNVVYEIFDGSHTGLLERKLGQRDDVPIAAEVYSDISAEEMIDLRLRAAAESTPTLRFARTATLIPEAFAQTAFAEKGVTVLQAITWAENDTPKRSAVNNVMYVKELAEIELSELKDWVRKKAVLSGYGLGTLYTNIFKWLPKADPQLIKEARSTGSSKIERRGIITRALLEEVATLFPGEQNFDLQRITLKIASQAGLPSQKLKEFIRIILSSSPQLEGSEAGIQEETTSAQREEQLRTDLNTALSTITNLQEKISTLRIENTTSKEHATRSAQRAQVAEDEAEEARSALRRAPEQEVIDGLRAELRTAKETITGLTQDKEASETRTAALGAEKTAHEVVVAELTAQHTADTARIEALEGDLAAANADLAKVTRTTPAIEQDSTEKIAAYEQVIAKDEAATAAYASARLQRRHQMTIGDLRRKLAETRQNQALSALSFNKKTKELIGQRDEARRKAAALLEENERLKSATVYEARHSSHAPYTNEQQSPDWEEIAKSVTSRDGTLSWFMDKFRNGERELPEGDRHKLTVIFTSQARKLFSAETIITADGYKKQLLHQGLDPEWDEILSNISDGNGHVGLDAIDYSLSNRLAYVASELGWGKDAEDKYNPEFVFLSGMHFMNLLKARLDAPDVPENKLNRWITVMNSRLSKFRFDKSQTRFASMYGSLLQCILYSDVQNENHQYAAAIMHDDISEASARRIVERFIGKPSAGELKPTFVDRKIKELFTAAIFPTEDSHLENS